MSFSLIGVDCKWLFLDWRAHAYNQCQYNIFFLYLILNWCNRRADNTVLCALNLNLNLNSVQSCWCYFVDVVLLKIFQPNKLLDISWESLCAIYLSIAYDTISWCERWQSNNVCKQHNLTTTTRVKKKVSVTLYNPVWLNECDSMHCIYF